MRVIVFGHRGYPVRYPENTLLSFIASLLYGLDGFELDVWLSGDGEVVVIHDEKTGRVGDVDLSVKKSSYEELKRVYLGMGQTIPRLIDVYNAVPRNIPVIVELKDPDAVDEAYSLTRGINRLENTIFTSFNHEIIAKLYELDNKIHLGINIGSLQEFEKTIKFVEEIRVEVIAVPILAPVIIGWKKFMDAVNIAKTRGLKIFVWTPIGSDIDKILPLHEKLYNVYDAAIVNDAIKEGGLIKRLLSTIR